MSTKTHDDMINEAAEWARSLGYKVVERNRGTATGADAVFENQVGEKVVLEVVSGSSFRKLFAKPRIQEMFIPRPYAAEPYMIDPTILGLIIVGDRIDNVKNHGVEVGLPRELFDPPKQFIFPVLQRHFDKVIPVLLVSLLGGTRIHRVAS